MGWRRKPERQAINEIDQGDNRWLSRIIPNAGPQKRPQDVGHTCYGGLPEGRCLRIFHLAVVTLL
jgi:hypothetical protein